MTPGFGLLADDRGLEAVTLAAVVAGFDDFGVARRISGIERCRARDIGFGVAARPLRPKK